MREYGQIQCGFWQSPDIQRISDSGKLLAAYLLTGPHSNGLGCFRLPDGYIMADLGWSQSMVIESLHQLSINRFGYRFDGVVLMPNFLRWNPVINPNSATAREREFDALPAGDSKIYAAQAIIRFPRHFKSDFLNRCRTIGERLQEDLLERYRQQEQTRTDPTATALDQGKTSTVVAMRDAK